MQAGLFDDEEQDSYARGQTVRPRAPRATAPTGEADSSVTRRAGYQKAGECASSLHKSLLTLYGQRPMTDAEVAEILKIERTTVNARRNELIKLGKVVGVGLKKNPRSGVVNVLWGLKIS